MFKAKIEQTQITNANGTKNTQRRVSVKEIKNGRKQATRSERNTTTSTEKIFDIAYLSKQKMQQVS
jgi:hypothetical protein